MSAKQLSLVSELLTVYPLETKEEGKVYSIRGLELPLDDLHTLKVREPFARVHPSGFSPSAPSPLEPLLPAFLSFLSCPVLPSAPPRIHTPSHATASLDSHPSSSVRPPLVLEHQEEHASTALGYTCHLVSLLSKYLETPLRYTPVHVASRSYMRDDVNPHLPKRQFPLYFDGVSVEDFTVAVRMLQRDVEQLLHAHGLATSDREPTHILANLMQLLSVLLDANDRGGET